MTRRCQQRKSAKPIEDLAAIKQSHPLQQPEFDLDVQRLIRAIRPNPLIFWGFRAAAALIVLAFGDFCPPPTQGADQH